MNAAIAIFFFLVFNLTCSVAFIWSRPFGMSPALLRKSKLLRAAPLHEYQTIFRDRLSHFMETGNVKMPTDGQGEDWALRTNYIDLTALEELFKQQDEADSEQASAPSVTYSSKSTTTSQAEFLIEQRIKKAKESKSDAASSAIAFSSILNEMKDKGIWNADLIESVMLHIAKLEAPRKVKHTHGTHVSGKLHVKSGQMGRTEKNEQTRAPPIPSQSIISIQNSITSKQISALKLYIKAAESKDITVDTAFLRKYILSLYLHNSPAATPCVELLLPLQLISVDTLLPGEVCASIHAYGLHRTDELEQTMQHKLAAYYAKIDAYSIHDAHLVLRTLSRYQLIPTIFTLLRYVRESSVLSSNVETIELLSQSLVRTVSKGLKAESMAELLKSEADYPEVVFVGRSNVGKSSLVNCLLNRKALASTSATPGHTRAFHLFAINQPTPSAVAATSAAVSATGVSTTNPLGTRANRSKVATNGEKGSTGGVAANAPVGAPITLKFVDVPGLGFAGNTSENTVTSWRGLLERYLHRRDALRVVCHLVDARHGVTDVDREMISIAARAAEERQSNQISPFQYTIVLTKTDKIDHSELNRIAEDAMRRRASPAWSRALSITLLIAVSILDVVDSKKIHIRRQNNNAKIFIYIGFVVFLFCLFFIAGWCAREFCPRGPIFTPLELDEIRLDRLDDIESSLKTSISTLKDKLAFHRKKKTQVQTDRDIKRRLGDRVERFNDEGRAVYGEAWDEGHVPVREVAEMTKKEVKGMRREAEQIVQERKEEEKEDLWKLWNEMRQDKPPEQPTIAKSPINERDNDTKGAKKMNFTSSNHSIAESIARMNAANVNVNNGYTANSYGDNNHAHVTKPSATETVTKESAAAPAAYSYNNNRYDYTDAAPLVNKLPSVGSASQLRSQPPILDLSKLTAPPAHIKAPTSKPPPMQLHNPMHMKSNQNLTNNQNNQNPTASAPARDSIKPAIRGYPPGKRPAPPAGPKPNKVNNNNINSNEDIDRLANPNIGTPPTKLNPSIHNNGNNNSTNSTGGVQTMRRPPPPLLAPPPGYVPGNSMSGKAFAPGRNPLLNRGGPSARPATTEAHEKDR